MSSKMDAILALDRPPFLAFDPLNVCDGVEFWPVQPFGIWYVQPGARMPDMSDIEQPIVVIVEADRSKATLIAARIYVEWNTPI